MIFLNLETRGEILYNDHVMHDIYYKTTKSTETVLQSEAVICMIIWIIISDSSSIKLQSNRNWFFRYNSIVVES